MKKLIFLFFLLSTGLVFSQEYGVLIEITNLDDDDTYTSLDFDIGSNHINFTKLDGDGIFRKWIFMSVPNTISDTGNIPIELWINSAPNNTGGGDCDWNENVSLSTSSPAGSFTELTSCKYDFTFTLIHIDTPSPGTEISSCGGIPFNTFPGLGTVLTWQWSTDGDANDPDVWNDFYASSNHLLSNLDGVPASATQIWFRIGYEGIFLAPNAPYTINPCAPQINASDSFETTNASCFAATDGSITLNFTEDLVDSDHEMRVFVFAGTPPAGLDTSSLVREENPDFPGFPDLPLSSDRYDMQNSGSNYTITIEGLQGSDEVATSKEYFIIYQEVNYDASPVYISAYGADPIEFVIQGPSKITPSVNVGQANCSGDSAELNFSAVGGDEYPGSYMYQYKLNDTDVWTNVVGSSALVPPTTDTQTVYIQATYTYTNRPESCTSSQVIVTDAIEIAPVFEYVLANTRKGQDPSPGGSDGTIEVELNGGTSDVTLEIHNDAVTPTLVQSTTLTGNDRNHIFVGLPAGTYYLRAVDANPCTIISPVTYELQSAPIPQIQNFAPIAPFCNNGSDGQVTVTLTGTIEPYTYRIKEGDITGPIINPDITNNGTETEFTINNLNPGIHTIEMIFTSTGDFNTYNTVERETFIIGNPDAITISLVDVVSMDCNGTSDGYIEIQVSEAGDFEYAYRNLGEWIDLDASNRIPITQSDTYNDIQVRKVRDINDIVGCVSTNELDDVFVPEGITITEIIGSHQDIVTNGLSTGSLEVLIEGGIPNYSYAWTRSETFNSAKIAFIPALPNSTNTFLDDIPFGFYEVTVTDSNGCFITSQQIEITQPGPLGITTLNPTDVICKGEFTGSITAIVTGAPPLTYTWTKTGDLSFTAPNAATITNLSAGEYTLSLTDTSGDPAVTQSVQIIEPTNAVSATILKTDTCSDIGNGSITISNVTGGTGTVYDFSKDGGATFQPNPLFETLTAGDYDVVVRDENNCVYTETVSIIPFTAITLDTGNTVVNNVSEQGLNNGSITPFFNGGSGSYTYVWIGPNVGGITNKDITNLEPEEYTITVTDTNGCSSAIDFTIAEPGSLSVTISEERNSCFGENNGSITASVVGTGPYTLQWFDASVPLVGETGLTLQNIGEGTYTLNIIDNGSTPAAVGNSPAVELIENLEVNADVAVTPTCSGESSGSIIFSDPKGSLTSSYSFSIDGVTFFNDQLVFDNLAADIYQLVIRANDNLNCDRVISNVEIQTSPILYYNIAGTLVTRASGPNATDGAITASVSDGTPPYQYSIDDGTTFQSTPVFSGLGEGTYNIVVMDDVGCSVTSEGITVTEIGPLQITNIVPSNALCKAEANGSIATTVTGEGDITYEWTLADESAVPVSNGTDGEDITGILEGSYKLKVTDDNSTLISAAIYVGEPTTALTIDTINSTNTTCNGVEDGTLQITASGGTMPYQYSINGVDFQPLSTFANLSNGQYTVTVQDANGCSTTEPTPILITEPVALSFIINEQRALTAANASDGAITITPSGGSGDYLYSWTGPNFTSTEEDIFGLEGGDYFLTLTDLNNTNCSISFPEAITITEPGELLVTNTQIVFLECNGQSFAEIEANVQGGIAPFTYAWFQVVNGNNVSLTEDTNLIGNLSAGEYFVRVTDANNIVANANSIVVNEPQSLQITVDSSTNVLCNGEATGAISISVSGGTLPYQYIWDNGDTVEDINGLQAGDYTIEILDANMCVAEETITITDLFNAIEITDASVSNTSEYQANDGSVSLNVTGGLASYTYSWTRDSDNTNAGGQATIANLSADSYSVIITDANGCSISETYEVTQPDIVEDTIVPPACAGDANGSISVLVNQGNGNFTYTWSTGATTNSINNLEAGAYNVTIDGFGNGPLTRTYVLEDPLPLEVNLGEDRVLCVDQEVLLDATVEDTTATYSWTSDNGFSSNAASITPTITGNYTVTVQTLSGCMAQGSIFIDITTDEIDAEFAMSSQVFVGETIVAVDISYPLPDGIEWIMPLQGTILTQDTDAVEFSFAEAGEYEITMITIRGACIAQKTKKVIVLENDGTVPLDDSKDGTKTIEDFIIYPNPTTGVFTADVNLTERGNISIKVFSFANNQLVASEKERGSASYSVPFNISGMPPGVYAVLLETPVGSYLQKIIIK